jgi:Na+-driven multidrug efflux pump
MVVSGIKSLIASAATGIETHMGSLFAKDDREELVKTFSYMEWIIHTVSILLFSCTAILIVPFVSVYTVGISDTNYIIPAFALLITLANAFHSFRLPYSITILGSGHYKQTQNSYIVAALINIILSIILVIRLGLIGVAIGTAVSMLFQTIWMAYYSYREVLKCKMMLFYKQITIDIISVVLIWLISFVIDKRTDSYFTWFILSTKVFLVNVTIIVFINFMFYNKNLKNASKKIISIFMKRG